MEYPRQFARLCTRVPRQIQHREARAGEKRMADLEIKSAQFYPPNFRNTSHNLKFSDMAQKAKNWVILCFQSPFADAPGSVIL